MKDLIEKTEETSEDIVSIVKDLFNHYDHNDSALNYSSSYEDYKKEAAIFLQEMNEEKREKLKCTLSTYDLQLDDVNRKELLEATDIYEYNLGFYNFYNAVKNVLENYEPSFLNFKGSDRQKSPPLKAYEFAGHNKELEVNKISYSYLTR